jgi:predicted enzyme related to lactoylglutathione lyase
MDPVVHFEMPYDDAQRVAKFYKAVFGWNMQPQGAKMDNYVLARTTESDGEGWPKKVGRINGGFFPKKPDWPAQYPSLVIAVANIKQGMEKVRASGGKVLGEPTDIPGVGSYVSFTDTEGNRVGILQPRPGGMEPKAKKAKPAKQKRK